MPQQEVSLLILASVATDLHLWVQARWWAGNSAGGGGIVAPCSCVVWDASSMCLHGKARPPDHFVLRLDIRNCSVDNVWNGKGRYQRATIDLADHLGLGFFI